MWTSIFRQLLFFRIYEALFKKEMLLDVDLSGNLKTEVPDFDPKIHLNEGESREIQKRYEKFTTSIESFEKQLNENLSNEGKTLNLLKALLYTFFLEIQESPDPEQFNFSPYLRLCQNFIGPSNVKTVHAIISKSISGFVDGSNQS